MSYEKSLIDSKQDDLISGTNIKTINGASILGSGDLTVTGGGVSDGDYGDITVSSSGTVWNIDAATVGVTELSATGTPSATTFLRGDNTWAAPTSVDPAGWTTIVKSANQDVTNSATLVSDTSLQFSVVAGGHYMIELDAVISSNSTTADYKNAFNVSAGTMKGSGISISNTNGGVGQVTNITAPAAASTNSNPIGTSSADLDMLFSTKIIFSFTASANATFRYQFAQNSAVLATTARTWKGSILKYKRID
jgi:hypothetical protein